MAITDSGRNRSSVVYSIIFCWYFVKAFWADEKSTDAINTIATKTNFKKPETVFIHKDLYHSIKQKYNNMFRVSGFFTDYH